MTLRWAGQLATVLRAAPMPLRDGAHYATSALICTAATAAGIDPGRVKFKRTVRIRRRAGFFYPRVVKRARHNSCRVNKPGHHDAPTAIKLCNLALTREKTENAA